jgi:hypothetical protein
MSLSENHSMLSSMKSILSCASLAAGVSLFAASPLFGQTAAARPSSTPANQPPDVILQQDKEQAEDAVLLQQLEAGPQPARENKPKNSLAPFPGGRSGGMAGSTAPVGLSYRGQNLLVRPVGAPKALLVRTSSPEPKSQVALEEDLAVMAHLLTKAIDELPGGQARPMNALGIELTEWSRSGPMRSLYLDNYGAVFFLGVGFPLVAPEEKPPEEKPGADSAWEDARQELYGLRPNGVMGGEPAEEYSQEKVAKLKETLLESLKNAANIRELKPDEFITIWVAGGVTGGAARHRVFKNNPPGALGGNFEVADQPGSISRRTILTIRATKTDIDSYAKGSLTAEEFQKHARITAYTDDARGAGFDGLTGGGGLGGVYTGRARFDGKR